MRTVRLPGGLDTAFLLHVCVEIIETTEYVIARAF